ncbi:hypothetical protein AX16_004148 [Volvariella volvacea WC 439]|nr:hypothetical protein AX16_004148 [Volvariella volvacea WC 439]
MSTWQDFMKELSGVYGKRSDVDTAKEELSALWNNKNLAKKDFIKFVEQYHTLVHFADYEDKIYIDKLTLVISQELHNAIIMYEIEGKLPNNWDAYLKLLLKAFKALHPDCTKGSIFGTGSSNEKEKDPNTMEVDSAKKTKGKEVNSQTFEKKFCSYCNKNNPCYKNIHNTANCQFKPKDKKSLLSKSLSSPSKDKKNSKQNHMQFKAHINELQKQFAELMKEGYDLSDSDAGLSTSTKRTASISIVRIIKISDKDFLFAKMEATPESNDLGDESDKWPNKSWQSLDFLKKL